MQDTNTDEDYHRSMTTKQLQYELMHHKSPGADRHYTAASIKKRVALIEKILKERNQ